MQEAIKKFIKLEFKKGKCFNEISEDIDRVRKYEIKKAMEKQRIQWRKNMKLKGVIK